MKYAFLNFILILALPMLSIAQIVEVANSTIKYDKAERPCIMVELEAGPKTLKGAWKDYLKDKHDVKLKGFGFLANKDLLDAEEVQFEALSDKAMNFYTHFDEKKDKTQMCVFASLGYDIYLSPGEYPKEYRAMRKIVDDFISDFVPRYYEQQVEESEEQLSGLEAEIKSLKDDISNNEKQIEKNRKEIEKLRKENIGLSAGLDKKAKRLQEVEKLLKEQQEKLKAAKRELQ
ncbi:MAG: hypothetical protein J5I94_17555 [Phaeodactylibacter sp.]|nr:hypothetical protein [Phaeodactylibacter sp.]